MSWRGRWGIRVCLAALGRRGSMVPSVGGMGAFYFPAGRRCLSAGSHGQRVPVGGAARGEGRRG